MSSVNSPLTWTRADGERRKIVSRRGLARVLRGARRGAGARPRTFLPDEDRINAPPAVILSDAFWTREYARDPFVVGRALTLDDRPFTIVGVMPREFAFPFGADDLDASKSRHRAAVHRQSIVGRPLRGRPPATWCRRGTGAAGARSARPAVRARARTARRGARVERRDAADDLRPRQHPADPAWRFAAPASSCSPSRAPTSSGCFSCGRSRGSAIRRCASRSVRRAGESSGSGSAESALLAGAGLLGGLALRVVGHACAGRAGAGEHPAARSDHAHVAGLIFADHRQPAVGDRLRTGARLDGVALRSCARRCRTARAPARVRRSGGRATLWSSASSRSRWCCWSARA